MKIGILGGSFNPAHEGHVLLSMNAMKKLKLNQVWWIVADKNPFKKSGAGFEDRVKQCIDITNVYKKIKIKKIRLVFTDDVISKLLLENPQYEFVWIMGGDCLCDFDKWKNFKKFIMRMQFAVFARDGFLNKASSMRAMSIYNNMIRYKTIDRNLPSIRLFRTKEVNISSSKIRAAKNL